MTSIRIDSLIPGTEYWVDIHWNLLNTVRTDNPEHFVGKFIRLEYIIGKTRTNPETGLVTMIEPGRTNIVFQYGCNGHERHVSSMNKFYQRYRPPIIDIRNKNNLRNLINQFPPEILRIIESFYGGSKYIKHIRTKNHNENK